QVNSSGGTTGGVQGSVTQVTGGASVGGGSLEVLTGTTVVSTVAVSPGGLFNLGGLTPGAYDLRLHPNHGFSLGLSEPDTKPVTVAANAVATVNFAVIPAIIYDDFQSYANTAALVNASTGLGKHGAGPGVNS